MRRLVRTIKGIQHSLAYPRLLSSPRFYASAASKSYMSNNTVQSLGNFNLVKRHALPSGNVSFSKWRSQVTGLNVIHVDYEAPIAKGYFIVPTEIFNDSGCPHTLEHLVFMGSERFPYKGVLDNLANRAFSEGTNAWTDTDHTCYTIATAGQDGFLQLLPIYADHILYPTLTDQAFVTEVHHIDPKGEDSGVVYSEMQGRENTPGDLISLRMSRLINPPGSAYRSETGGLMEALRKLTVQQIRDYHGKYYVPYNLCLMVCGRVSTEALLQVLQDKVEPSIIKHAQSRPADWKRPFLETPSANREPLTETRKEVVEFPEKDESAGEVVLTFKGTAPDDFLTASAIDILSVYLTSSPVAPLNKEFVEIPSPLCTEIYIYESTRAKFSDISIYAASVPTEHLETFDEKLRESLHRIVKEGIDMQRMQMVINRERRKFYSRLESSKGDVYSDTIVSDFLYGKENGDDLPLAMDDIGLFDKLVAWSGEQWADLLNRFFVSPAYAVVSAKPSAQLARKLDSDEKKRIAEQVARLGEKGLAEAAKTLEAAQEYNERPIPSDYITSFPLPDVGSIAWIPIQSAVASDLPVDQTIQNDLSKHLASDPSKIPIFSHYNHVKSDFVTVHAFFSASGVPNELKPYIAPYLTSFFSLPLASKWKGRTLNHEEVVNSLEDETVSYDIGLGLEGYFTQLIRVSIKVEVAKYDQAIQWLNDLIYRSVFDKERLSVTAAKLQQALPEAKRDGNSVAGALSESLLYSNASVSRAGSVLEQIEFIPRLVEDLKSNPEKVVKAMDQLRQHLIQPSGLRFAITGNIIDVPEPKAPWTKAFEELKPTSLEPVPLTKGTLSPMGLKPAKKAVVLTLPSIESAYTINSTRGIQGFNHPSYPPIRVALEVLNATEGFLWRFIRGAGLAYGAYAGLDIESGMLSFSTYRSANPFQAFQEARKVIHGLADGSLTFDNTQLDSCKSAIVYSVTKRVSTPGSAAITSFGNQVLRGISQDHNVALLEKYKKVTVSDVVDVIREHFLPLFDPARSVAAIVVGPSKAEHIAEGLESVGYEIERRELSVDPMLDEHEHWSESGDSEDSDGSEMSVDK